MDTVYTNRKRKLNLGVRKKKNVIYNSHFFFFVGQKNIFLMFFYLELYRLANLFGLVFFQSFLIFMVVGTYINF